MCIRDSLLEVSLVVRRGTICLCGSDRRKEPRNFGLHRVKQLAVVRQLTDIIQRPPNAVPRPTIRQTKA